MNVRALRPDRPARRVRTKPAIRISFAAALLLSLLAHAGLAGAATITIVNADGADEGFNDPTAVSPVGGNPGTTRGAQRLNAFEFAADIWGGLIDSDVTILVSAQFNPQTCTTNAATLGSAGPVNIVRDWTGAESAPFAGTFYHVALGNAFAGGDLVPANADITATFNSNIDAGCFSGAPNGWYYGIDGAPSSGTIDIVPILLHEMAHGLGFSSLVSTSTGGFTVAGFPTTFSHFARDEETGLLWSAMTDAQRLASTINDPHLVWTGANVAGSLDGFLNSAPSITTSTGPAGTWPGTISASLGPQSFDVTGNVVIGDGPSNFNTTLDVGFEAGSGFSVATLNGQQGWTVRGSNASTQVSTANPSAGTQHVRVQKDAGLAAGTQTGAVSPLLDPQGPEDPNSVAVDVSIGGKGGATYTVALIQTYPTAATVAQVTFDDEGSIFVMDDLGAGFVNVDTGFDWVVGAYRTLRVNVNPLADTIEYVYGGATIYNGVAGILGAPNTQQVLLLSDNNQGSESGDFDVLDLDSNTSPGTGDTTDGCSAFENAAQIAGKIVLVDTGNCTVATKATNAQNAGAIGVIVAHNSVANSSGNGLPTMSGSASISIPVVGAYRRTGTLIKNAVAAGPLTATLGFSMAGTSNELLRLHAPNPVTAGSSVSHWTQVASPNLLMEHIRSADLGYGVDRTMEMFFDIGWQSPPTPTPTPSPTASPTVTPSPTRSPTASPSASPTPSPSPSPSASPTRSPSASPSASPTASPSASPTRSPSPTASPSPTPSPTPSPSPTVSPTASPSPTGPPENDCADARCVGDRVTVVASTAGASGTDITSCGSGDTADAWFSYTPSLTGTVTIDTLGSAIDTTLAVFDACGGTQLACNNDAPGGGTTSSLVSLSLTAGTTYLVRVAGVAGATGSVSLTVTGGSGGCILTSPNEENGGRFGVSVVGANDVTGDSTPDLLIGAYFEDPGAAPVDSGVAYLFSGASLESALQLTSPNAGVQGLFGRNVRGIGDVSGDGQVDFVVSAPGETVGGLAGAGRAYLVSGATGATLRTFESPNAEAGGQFGARGNGINDVTGDGKTDILVTSTFEDPGASPTDAGRAYVFNSQSGALFRTFASPNEEADGNFGLNAIGIKDVTGDGKGELLVGAPGEDPGALPTDAGMVYLFNGATGTLVWQAASPDPRASGFFGRVVSRLDDVTGDGKMDVAVGAPDEKGSGRVHLFNGATGAFLRTLMSPSPESGGLFGQSITNILDANGDGWGDLVIGAPNENTTLTDAGRAYVFSGRNGTLLLTLQSPQPEASAEFGYAVGTVPDLDGNGFVEFLVGSRKADPGASPTDAGRAYLFYGRLLP